MDIRQNAVNIQGMQTNRNRVFQLVYQKESISKPEIASQLGVSLPTAIQNVKNLQQEGLLEEGETLESTGGRKAIAVTYCKNAKYSIGVDITRNHIGIVLINLAIDIIQSTRIQKSFQNSTNYFQELAQMVEQLIAFSGINTDDILGVGYSIPGNMTLGGAMLIYSHSLRTSGLQSSVINRGLKYPAVLCNDANAAGIAEMWKNKSQNNAVYLSLSNTVGGSILPHNELYLGENQRAGEFGHMTLIRDGLPCYCGQKGCVDAYCSAQLLSNHTGGNLGLFFEKLKNGDTKLQSVWKEYSANLATVLNNLAVSFDCNVILGGYMGEYLAGYIDEIRSSVSQLTSFSGIEDYIVPCTYEKEAAAVGAALIHIRSFIRAL
jgi:predicted NBD/HSP70 family sugar kinase/plasmid maintenance system antidote protein VapI